MPIAWLLLVILLSSCGKEKSKDEYSHNPEQREEDTPLPPDRTHSGDSHPSIILQSSFDSTLEGVRFKGVRCLGGEILTTHWRRRPGAYQCLPDQWMITMINPTTCLGDICSDEFLKQTFLANLRLAPPISSGVAYYYIRPLSPLSNENWNLLHRSWVRSEMRGRAHVVYRQN